MNRYVVVAIAVPVLLLFARAFANKLIRGRGWNQQDFWLGVEFLFASLFSGISHIFALAKNSPDQSPSGFSHSEAVMNTGYFILAAFFVLIWVLTIHQEYEQHERKWIQFFLLVIYSNILGVGSMVIGLWLLKEVG